MVVEGRPAQAVGDAKTLRLLMPATSPDIRVGALVVKDRGEVMEQTTQRCGLAQCRKPDCNLRSHRQFAALRRRHVHAKDKNDAGLSLSTVRPKTYDDVLDRSVIRIEQLMADGLKFHSIRDERSSIFRELAHHYFSNQIDRLIQVYSPHLDRRKYKSTMMDHALSNGIFCVCIMANAKTDMLMRGHVRVADRDSEIVYATTAHILRQQLDNFKPTDAEWLLVLVVALVGFDLAFNRRHHLERHHNALRQLTSMRGGIATVGHTRPYVLNTDRFLAVFTGTYPICRQTPMLPVTPVAVPRPCPYGKAFETLPSVDDIDQPVLDFCLDHCQLIHLVESAGISLSPRSKISTDLSVVPYFLYERDRLHCSGTCLYADYHENQNTTGLDEKSNHKKKKPTWESTAGCKSRCVLLAAMIIEYTVVQGNYYTVKGPFLADQLKSILLRQSGSEWSGNRNLILWILFVLVVVPKKWKDRLWALNLLQHLLEQRYDQKWPYFGWQDEQLGILREFVWSESFHGAYAETCMELLTGRISRP